MKCCETCALWQRESAARTPTGKYKRDATARCLWKPEIVWPESILPERRHLPTRNFMRPTDGTNCDAWTPPPPPKDIQGDEKP